MRKTGRERSKSGDQPSSVRESVFTGEDRLRARKVFSMLGLGCFAFLAISSVLQVVAARVFPNLASTTWGLWLVDLVPMYAVALPVSLLIFRKVPTCQGVSGSKNGVPLKAGQIVRSVFIIIFLTNAGNVVGILVTRILGALAGTSTESALGSYAMDTSVWLQILFMSVVGPFFEELIFRKLLIDRMSCYGGKLAVVTSALMFGLSHGNLSQFFYTFAMGLLCGYIYLKTGRLRYSAGLHMGINFLGVMESFVMLSMVSLPDGVGDMTVRQLVMALVMVIGIVAVVAATIIGLVMFNRARKTVLYENEPLEIPKGSRFRTAYCNIGMALFVLACVIMFVTSLI